MSACYGAPGDKSRWAMRGFTLLAAQILDILAYFGGFYFFVLKCLRRSILVIGVISPFCFAHLQRIGFVVAFCHIFALKSRKALILLAKTDVGGILAFLGGFAGMELDMTLFLVGVLLRGLRKLIMPLKIVWPVVSRYSAVCWGTKSGGVYVTHRAIGPLFCSQYG